MRKVKKNNHYYSKFHVVKWFDNGGKIYDKETNTSRKIDLQKDFSIEYYYSESKKAPTNELEDRISVFESYIGEIIKKVDTSYDKVHLTGKEYEMLKLYCMLCANRHHFSTEVIKKDKSGIYKSNNYIFGVPTVKTKEESLNMTELIIEEFEMLRKQKEVTATIYNQFLPYEYPCPCTAMLHLEILRSQKPDIIISNRCCLTENTMDSNYLYTYVPVSPFTALLLIKSTYYLDLKTFEDTKRHFGKKYGNGMPDPYISEVFYEYENLLFSSSYLIRSNVHIGEVYIKQEKTSDVYLAIKDMPTSITTQMNSMLCEDGDLILYCDDAALENALKTKMPYREITLH